MVTLRQYECPFTDPKQNLLNEIKRETERFRKSDNPVRELRLENVKIDNEIAEALRNLILSDTLYAKRGDLDNKRLKVDGSSENMWNVTLSDITIDGNVNQVKLLLEEALSVVHRLVLKDLRRIALTNLVDFLFCSPKALTNLTELSLSHCLFDFSNADAMNRWMKHNKSLKKLCLNHVRIRSCSNAESFKVPFMERMFQNVDSHAVQSLEISAIDLDVHHLVQVIQSWRTLEELKFDCTDVKNLDTIVYLFCHPSCCRLKSLSMRNGLYRDEKETHKILSALPHSSIESMTISVNVKNIHVFFQELLGCLLHPSTKLRQLHLRHCYTHFSDDQEKAILDNLKTTNFRLEVLCMGITKDFIPYLVLNWAGRRLLQDLNYPMLSSVLPHVLVRITSDNIETMYKDYYRLYENERIGLSVNARYHLLREGLLVACCIGDNK